MFNAVMQRVRSFALIVLVALAWPAAVHAQAAASGTPLGVPVQPAVPGAEVGGGTAQGAAAADLVDRLNAAPPGAIVTPRRGRVLLGSGVDAQADIPPRTRGFLQPSFVPVPTAPVVPQANPAGFHAGYATPGFFGMRRNDAPAAVENLYTSPEPGQVSPTSPH